MAKTGNCILQFPVLAFYRVGYTLYLRYMEDVVIPNTTQAVYYGSIVPYYPHAATETFSAPFGTRVKKTFMFIFGATIVGAIVSGIGAVLEWNWLYWTGAGLALLIVIAGMYTIFTLRIGKCPYCHQEIGRTSDIDISSGDDNAQIECHTCSNWLVSNKGTIRAFTKADIQEDTEFKCKIIENSTWPRECLVCGVPPVRFIELKNTKLNAGALLVGRISVSWGSLKNAPYCNIHEDAVQLKVDGDDMFLLFRDYDTMKRYQHVNYHKLMTGQQL